MGDPSKSPPGTTESVAARVEQFYAAYREQLLLFLWGILRDREAAEDVLQQTFSKLQVHLLAREQKLPLATEERKKNTTGLPADTASPATSASPSDNGAGTENSVGWLFRVARNEAVQWKRNQHRTARHQQALSWFWEQIQPEPRDLVQEQEQRDAIWQAVAELPPELRVVIQFRIVEDLKFREIAEQLKVPLGTVLTRMSRAVTVLRERIQDFP